MGLLERKAAAILGGRELTRKEAAQELSHKFRINRKEADGILRSMKKKGIK